WVRYSVVVTFSVAPTVIAFANNDGATPGQGWDIALPQLELGAFPTSPIATTSAAATRSADAAIIAGLSLASPLTLGAAGNLNVASDATTRYLATLDDTTANNFFHIRRTNTGGGRVSITAAGVNGVVDVGGTYTGNGLMSVAGRASSTDIAASGNGTSVVIGGAKTLPALTKLWLGTDNTGGSGFLNGYLQ